MLIKRKPIAQKLRAEGKTYQQIADRLGITKQKAWRWSRDGRNLQWVKPKAEASLDHK